MLAVVSDNPTPGMKVETGSGGPQHTHEHRDAPRKCPNSKQPKKRPECPNAAGLEQIDGKDKRPGKEHKRVEVVADRPSSGSCVADDPECQQKWQGNTRGQIGPFWKLAGLAHTCG